jgi:hypothetical protein
MTRYAFILATTLSLSNLSLAAPCCGGTANVPSLISGDDRTQLTATISSVNVVAEAGVGGGIKDRSGSDHEAAQTIRLDTATLLTDRLQAGITLPITRRSRSRGNNEVDATGLGDVAISIGYEVLPEWNYSSWRPRGLLFITTTIPTGGSIYDASKLYRIDSRGRGFYTLGAGTLLTKAFGNWDTSLLFEGHRAFPRSLNNELGVLTLVPGWGVSGMASVGYSPWGGSFRLGLAVAPSLEDPVATEGVFTGEGAKTVLWNASAQISYMASEDISMSAIYSDQTLLGGSENSALNRAVAFLIQKRWGR